MTGQQGALPYRFPTSLHRGVLRSRYKRFFAEVELENGQQVTAHCPNTGPMTGVCQVGAPVYLSHHPDPKRKLAYTWEMIQVEGVWVGINTGLLNRLVEWGLEQGWFPQLAGFSRWQREVTCGRSKIDFLLIGDSGLAYLEVKNTTWAVGSRALFPDTVTTRGQKHLEDLIEIRRQGQRALLLYWINRADCTEFAPGAERDPRYAHLFRQALQAGVEVLPYRIAVSPQGIHPLGLAKMVA
ncbi:DNA/RNA nuclease SfsA [Synechococcus sp. OH20]|uniref:DNA/RNA nuclease SfsA n=1 Tax=Synechococcus sp. OH20 TaxID=139337 RepID=UPI0039C662B9